MRRAEGRKGERNVGSLILAGQPDKAEVYRLPCARIFWVKFNRLLTCRVDLEPTEVDQLKGTPIAGARNLTSSRLTIAFCGQFGALVDGRSRSSNRKQPCFGKFNLPGNPIRRFIPKPKVGLTVTFFGINLVAVDFGSFSGKDKIALAIRLYNHGLFFERYWFQVRPGYL